MTKFTKKDIIILALVTLGLFVGLVMLINSQFPGFEWMDNTPYPTPNAEFVSNYNVLRRF